MDYKDFCNWLDGYLSGISKDTTLTSEQLEVIKAKLETTKEVVSAKPHPFKPNSNTYNDIDSNVLVRC